MNVEVDSKDVVRLIQQFLKENGLFDSLRTLQNETDVTLNTVDNLDSFLSDIHYGKWDSVLSQVSSLKIPGEKLVMLYEQVLLELLELGERDLAREILRTSEPMALLKKDQPERYLKLEHLSQRSFFQAADAYEMGSSKELKRKEIAEALSVEVSVVAPSRLLSLIGQALRFQSSHGMVPKGASIDLFSGGRRAARKDSEEKYPRKQAGQIRFLLESHPETSIFSPDGQSLVTGSVDGFIEVWDCETCKLRKDLDYQARDELMMHEEAVLCASFSRDGQYMATGSQGGKLKVWKLSTGACLKKFPQAHLQGITSVCFAKDETQLLTASFDQTARVHGLKGGKTLKEFRGHTSYVNAAIYAKDANNVLTASSDGTVKLWDVRTTECLSTFRPGAIAGTVSREATVHTLAVLPSNTDLIFVCPKGPQAYLMSSQGQVMRTFSSGKSTGGDFLCATLSPRGTWVYCVGEDGVLYTFDSQTGQLENVLQVSEKEVIGIAHHPSRNLVGTISEDGMLKLWKP